MKYRDVIKLLEKRGWRLIATKGSHLQYGHPTISGRVTVAGGGKLNKDVPPGTLRSILSGTSRGLVMNQKYLIVIEQADDGSYSAYVPDLPGCTTCGDSIDEVKSLMQEALSFHLNGLREAGLPIPLPTTVSVYITTPLVT